MKVLAAEARLIGCTSSSSREVDGVQVHYVHRDRASRRSILTARVADGTFAEMLPLVDRLRDDFDLVDFSSLAGLRVLVAATAHVRRRPHVHARACGTG